MVRLISPRTFSCFCIFHYSDNLDVRFYIARTAGKVVSESRALEHRRSGAPKLSLTTATFWLPSRSASLNSRPASKGTPMAENTRTDSGMLHIHVFIIGAA